MHVRWMIRRDVAEVLRIANSKNEQKVIDLLKIRNTIGMVVEKNETILGYMIYDLYEKEIVVKHIKAETKFAYVQLIDKLISKISGNMRRNSINIQCNPNDLTLLNELKMFGFIATHIIKGKKEKYNMRIIKDWIKVISKPLGVKT